MAQALFRYLAALHAPAEGERAAPMPLFGGVFAIFGHGNVAGLGEALYQQRDALPTIAAIWALRLPTLRGSRTKANLASSAHVSCTGTTTSRLLEPSSMLLQRTSPNDEPDRGASGIKPL
jgi:hypothetical protein